MDFPLAEFEQWLEANRSEIVGISHQDCDCPVARWLIYKYDKPVSVTCFHLIVGGNEYRDRKIPRWIARFVDTLDDTVGGQSPITGEAALSILRSLEP